MAAVQAEAVWFSYSDAVEVIADVSFRLESGFTGLVGDNGAGKSTLLGLVAGRLLPQAGRIRRLPPEARVVLCPQEVTALPPEVRDLAVSTDDLPSIERLEAAMVAWPGALVLVTHDPALARACTREVWRVAEGTVRP